MKKAAALFLYLLLAVTLAGTGAAGAGEKGDTVTLRLEENSVSIDIGDSYFIAPYLVQPGDTLEGIAESFYYDPKYAESLAKLNGLSVDSKLTPDTSIYLYTASFPLYFKPSEARAQAQEVSAFLTQSGEGALLQYSWSDVDVSILMEGETIKYEKFNPSKLVLTLQENEALKITFSFTQQPILDIFTGKTEIEKVEVQGLSEATGK